MSEVATINPQAIAPASETDAVIHMIERAARDPSIDMDKMERLLAWQERARDRISLQEWENALSTCQREMLPVVKDSSNPSTKSRYASYAALDKALRPVWTKHGLGLTFDTGDAAKENDVRVLCTVSGHGHRCTYHIDMPADGKGAKGGDVMTRTHAMGSAVTYGRRYLLMMIFNIPVADRDDDDGNAAGVQSDTISEEQVVQLAELIKETKSNLDLFCNYFKIDCLPALPAKDFDRAIVALEGKKKKGAA